MVRLKNKGILLFIILCLFLMIVIYVVPSVTNLLNVTYVAEYGELSIYDDVQGYVVREESVYKAVSSGKVNRLASEGQLLRAGSVAVEVTDGDEPEESENFTSIKERLGDSMQASSDYRLMSGGLISYTVDGYESELNSETAKDKGYKYFQKLDDIEKVDLPEATAHKGYPLFKVIQNGSWHLVAFIANKDANKYSEDSYLMVMMEPERKRSVAERESDVITMRVVSKTKSEGSHKLVLEADRYFDGIGKMRSTPVRLTTFSAKGLILEKSSLTKQDGQVGVYAKDKKGKSKFVPVNVLGEDDGKVVVSESYFDDKDGNKVKTLVPFADVIKDPN